MPKPKLIILDSYKTVTAGLSLDKLKDSVELAAIYDYTGPEECAMRIGDAQMILINKTVLTKEILSQCKSLKYIGIFATGYNTIDIDYCKKHSIVVSNVPGYSTNGVAQLTFTFILDLMFLTAKHDKEVHEGKWTQSQSFCFYDPRVSEVEGKTLGLVGFGNIARKVARIAEAFDMKVLVYSRTRYPSYETPRLQFVTLDKMLEQSDIVSLHVPLFPETTELINHKTISKMKDGAYLINTARGAIINEQDVADALNSGKLAGAGLDVLTTEPMRADNPLLDAKNCIITPHIAWTTIESRTRLIDTVIKNAEAFIGGTPHNNVAGEIR